MTTLASTQRIGTPSIASADGHAKTHANAVDGIRVLAALAIVWIHVPRTEALFATTVLARFAVPFFVFSAAYFATCRGLQDTGRTAWQYTVHRFWRIYVPFLVWSAVYLAFKGVKLWLAPDQPNDFPGWSFFFGGAAYHLWFLPFIFAGTVVAFLIGRAVRGTGYARLYGVYFVYGAILACLNVDRWPVHDSLQWMLFASPSVLWAVGFAMYDQRHPDRKRLPAGALLGGFALTLALSAMYGRHSFVENAAGAVLFGWAFRSSAGDIPNWIRQLAPLSFGIYLSHLLVIKSVESIVTKLEFAPTTGLDGLTYLLAVSGSLAITYLLTKSQRLAWLV